MNRFEDPGRRSADDIPEATSFAEIQQINTKHPNELKMALLHLATAEKDLSSAETAGQIFVIKQTLLRKLEGLDKIATRPHEPDAGFKAIGEKLVRRRVVDLLSNRPMVELHPSVRLEEDVAAARMEEHAAA